MCFSHLDRLDLRCDIEYVRLQEGQDRVLATDVSSPMDLPPFLRAAMDGYAVKSIDTKNVSKKHPAKVVLVGRLTAGHDNSYRIKSGETAAITTGAKLPEGADAVVMVEHTKAKKGEVMIYSGVKPGENISFKGEDVKKGKVLLEKGTWLAPQDIGLVASVGIDRVPVMKKPRVGVIATGNELVEPGTILDGVSIYESNRYVISCMIRQCGGEAIDLGVCRDDKNLIFSKLKEGTKFDMLVICGGTSVGETDYVPDLVNMLGKPGLIVRGVAMKPGSPTGLGIIGNKPVLLAPGFPVSSYFAFYTFGQPLLFKMLQTGGPPRVNLIARMGRSIALHKNMRTFVRVKVTKKRSSRNNFTYVAEPVSAGGARLLSTLTNSNGIVIVDDRDILRKGEKVQVIPLRNIDNIC